MKVETRDSRENTTEQRILVAMITDPIVLSKLAKWWVDSKGPLASAWSNKIGKWCAYHFQKHGSAPNTGIKSYFERWASRSQSQEEVKVVEQFLTHLSHQFESGLEIGTDILLDDAVEHINTIKARRLFEEG